MTLRRKMGFQIAAMIVGLLLVSGASLWGLNGLQHDYGVAVEGYERLRQVYEAGSHLATAQKLLRMPHPQTLRTAHAEIGAAVTGYTATPPPGPRWGAGHVEADAALRQGLRQLAEARPPEALADDEQVTAFAEAQRDAVTALQGRIAHMASGIRRTTQASEAAAQAKRRTTIGVTAGLCGAVIFAAIVLGVSQYRGVTRPLRRLSEGVRRVAAGQFTGRLDGLDSRGSDEFASLARDFGRMASELDGFYHALEQKVDAKSKQLVRSERLASLGYLAAGVAHEINNPLGIISGYAEYSLAELRDRPRKNSTTTSGDGAGEIEKSLRIICDEAFRCKEITGKLLSLARPGEGDRKPVSLGELAQEVASAVGGLKQYRDRRLEVRTDAEQDLTVLAVEAEMKQVLLNLLLNALEAVEPPVGRVRVEVQSFGGWVEFAVEDNGRGMTAEVLERAFEPFFSAHREPHGATTGALGHVGTGLGLSITHAIVTSHGGQIEAHSDGPGKGSRFTVRLPANPTMKEEG